MRNARSSANELVHSSFILIHYIIEMCWKMHLCGSEVGGNINRLPYTLITVDAVSGLVATVGIPLESVDSMRECENIMSIRKVVCDWVRAPIRP